MNTLIPRQNEIERVIQLISNMDTLGLASIVDKGARVEEVDGQVVFPPYIFENKYGRDIWLGQLSIAFQTLQQHGNSKLIPSKRRNLELEFGSRYILLKFKGNHSKHFLRLYLLYNSDNRLIDCYDEESKNKYGVPINDLQVVVWSDEFI